MARNIGAAVSTGATQAQIKFEEVTQVYIWGFIFLVISLVIAVAVGVAMNKHEMLGGNFVLAAIFLVAWAFFSFYPGFLIWVFGLGGLNGLPKDWSINKLIKEAVFPDLQMSEVAKQGIKLIKKYALWSAHLAFFATTVFVVLGTWKIENSSVVLPVLVVLSGIGLWTMLFTTGVVWYRRVTIVIMLTSLIILLYAGYTGTSAGKPEKDNHPAAAISSDASGVINTLKKMTGHGEWVTVARTTCSPTWNEDQGWCTVVSDAAKGTYRVIPRYKSWKLLQADGSFLSVPPYGLDLYAHWKNYEEFIDEFHRTGHKQGSNNYGALVVRSDDMEVIEALNSSRIPKEFEISHDGAEISINVNLIPNMGVYQSNKGEVIVEVQRQD